MKKEYFNHLVSYGDLNERVLSLAVYVIEKNCGQSWIKIRRNGIFAGGWLRNGSISLFISPEEIDAKYDINVIFL